MPTSLRHSLLNSSPPEEKKKRKRTVSIPIFGIKLALFGLLTFTAAIAISFLIFWDAPLASPVTELTTFRFLSEANLFKKEKKVVYGYLPYWNVSKVTVQPELTHLSYFGLTAAADGSIVTRTEDGTEPGYSRLNSDALLEVTNQVQANGGSIDIVIAQFNASTMDALFTSEAAQDNLIESIDDIILAYPISGVSLDFEYNGDPSLAVRNGLSQFVEKLGTHLDERYDNVELSIAVYASASNGKGLWDLPAMEPYLDYIVVMAYDFHRRSSPQAGPVAPLFGGDKLWDSDINQHLQEFVSYIPSEKLLLGVPFYGYEWQTTDRASQSNTFPETGATASIERVGELLKRQEELEVEEHWNEEALSPYLTYVEDGETYVLYYENSRSISYKLDYVNQLDLGGIAIWALGYEGASRELWDVVETKVR